MKYLYLLHTITIENIIQNQVTPSVTNIRTEQILK